MKMLAKTLYFTRAICLFYAANAWAGLPVERWQHSSGVQVHWVHSPAIAMVDVRIDFDAGSRHDPAPLAGRADAMAALLGTGVRASANGPALDENALGEAWADLGAQWGASASTDRLTVTLRSLSDPAVLGRAAALGARVLGEPVFDATLWARERDKSIASLQDADTRPGTVAGRAYTRAVYGDHPYGQEARADSLRRLSVQDLRGWHALALRPCRAKASVVGALDRAQADALVRTLLQALPQGACPPLAPVKEVAPLAQASAQHIPFDAAQAQVLMGQPGIARRHPDFLALVVANHVLGGGGFTSRLTAEVREQRGLTYSVSSHFSPGEHAGAFTIALQTRPDQADQALAVVRQVLQRFVAEGPTEAEVRSAQANLVGGFALQLDSNRKLLGQVANIAWYALPLDYLDTWPARVQALTRDQVHQAFARVVDPQRMATVVLGGRAP
ncbi:MAG: M16 family metallopeptidase [Rhodoferax sp.]